MHLGPRKSLRSTRLGKMTTPFPQRHVFLSLTASGRPLPVVCVHWPCDDITGLLACADALEQAVSRLAASTATHVVCGGGFNGAVGSSPAQLMNFCWFEYPEWETG